MKSYGIAWSTAPQSAAAITARTGTGRPSALLAARP